MKRHPNFRPIKSRTNHFRTPLIICSLKYDNRKKLGQTIFNHQNDTKNGLNWAGALGFFRKSWNQERRYQNIKFKQKRADCRREETQKKEETWVTTNRHFNQKCNDSKIWKMKEPKSWKNIIVVKQIQYNFTSAKYNTIFVGLLITKKADQLWIQLKHFLQHNNIYLLIAKLMQQLISSYYNQRS